MSAYNGVSKLVKEIKLHVSIIRGGSTRGGSMGGVSTGRGSTGGGGGRRDFYCFIQSYLHPSCVHPSSRCVPRVSDQNSTVTC